MRICDKNFEQLQPFINISIKGKKIKKTKTHVWSIFSILKNVNVVLIVGAVIKKEPKRKHTQKQSFAIPTVNRLNFRKLSISKKKCGNAIK